MGLKAVCLLKQTFATEAKIALDGAGAISRERVKEVINPYDEFGLEEAVKWQEAGIVSEITLLCLGSAKDVMESVRRGLAMGAEKAVILDTEGVPAELVDEAVTAAALGKKLASISFDVIFCGKVAVDSNAMEVPGRLAEILDIPLVSVIGAVKFEGGKIIAERESDGCKEIVEASLPAMVSADKSLNRPRYPNLPNIMKAKKKPVETVALRDVLGGEPSPTRRSVRYTLPAPKGACKFLEGPPPAVAAELVRRLRDEAKVIL